MEIPAITEAQAPGTISPRYVAHFRVRYGEIDAYGHVHNTVYLGYLEQAAYEHSKAMGYDPAALQSLGGGWLVRRHEIEFFRPAVDGDTLQVVTWAEEFRGARAFRRYAIYRLPEGETPTDGLRPPDYAPPGELLVEARTIWVWIDASGRPRRIPAELHPAFCGASPV